MNCSESNLRVADPLYLSARVNNWLYLLQSNLRNNQIGALSVITVTQIAFVIKYVIINFGSTSTIRTGMENEKLSKQGKWTNGIYAFRLSGTTCFSSQRH